VRDVLAGGAIMNSREANAVAEVLRQIENGPGRGWRDLLEGAGGVEPGKDGKGLDLRLADFQLWRDTWVRPALQAIVARYMKRGRRGSLGAPGASKSGGRFRATFRDAEVREARGVEPAPYWIGYYKGIALQAIQRVEELEAAESRS
jgi:hypothetical protein